MKKQLLSSLLLVAMVLTCIPFLNVSVSASSLPTEVTAPEGELWDGSKDATWYDANTYATTETYELSTVAQLAALKDIVSGGATFADKTIKLTKDLYMNNLTNIRSDSSFDFATSTSWNNYMISGFAGTFDGDDHTIYGMNISTSSQGVGLFNSIAKTGLVKNLHIMYAKIQNGRAYSGILCGNLQGSVDNVHVLGTVSGGWSYVGGLVGWTGASGNNWSGTLKNCSVRGSVVGTGVRNASDTGYVGGLIGHINMTTQCKEYINNCYVYADVSSDHAKTNVGGLIGYLHGANKSSAYFANCGVSGEVSGIYNCGKLIGCVSETGTNPTVLELKNIYVVGAPTSTNATATIGVLFGYMEDFQKNTLTAENVFVVTDEESITLYGKADLEKEIAYTRITTDVAKDSGDLGLCAKLNEWVNANPGSHLWVMGHHGYPALENTYVDDTVKTDYYTLEDVTTFAVLNGADLRINDAKQTRLRFDVGITASYMTELQEANPNATISLGALVCKTSDFKTYSVTTQASTILKTEAIGFVKTEVLVSALQQASENAYYLRAKSGVITPDEFTTAYSCLGYVKIEDEQGAITYINAPYAEENNARSAYDVAKAAYEDAEAQYSESTKAVLKSILDSVIYLSATEGGLQIVTPEGTLYKQPYTLDSTSTKEQLILTSDVIHADSQYTIYINDVLYHEGEEKPHVQVTTEEGKVTICPTFASEGTTTITLQPSKVSMWANFPETLTIACGLQGNITSAEELSWSSSNTNVVLVDNKGNLTPVAEGTAYIVATAPDGSVSNTVAITITPAVVRAENQKLTIGDNKSLGIKVDNYLPNPTEYGEARIALWKNNATGAMSITCDDSLTGDFDAWNAATAKYNIPVTFYVPGKMAGSDGTAWKKQIAAGQQVQSHTQTHQSGDTYNTWSTAQIWMEFYEPISTIEAVTGVPVHVIGYSYGWSNQTLASLIYISGRGVTGTPNYLGSINYMNLNSISGKAITAAEPYGDYIKTLFDTSVKVYNNSYYGGWTSFHFHSVSVAEGTKMSENVTVNNKTEWLDYWFSTFAPYVEQGKLYIDTQENVAKYGQERDTATLTVVSAGDTEMTFTLTDQMDDSIFDAALTIKVKVDATWKGATAMQNGVEREAKVVTDENGTYIFFDMVPDAGTLTLSAVKD